MGTRVKNIILLWVSFGMLLIADDIEYKKSDKLIGYETEIIVRQYQKAKEGKIRSMYGEADNKLIIIRRSGFAMYTFDSYVAGDEYLFDFIGSERFNIKIVIKKKKGKDRKRQLFYDDSAPIKAEEYAIKEVADGVKAYIMPPTQIEVDAVADGGDVNHTIRIKPTGQYSYEFLLIPTSEFKMVLAVGAYHNKRATFRTLFQGLGYHHK